MKNLNNKGNISIVACLLFTILLGFAAYVIDIGLIYAEKIRISNAIDAAALAATLELPKDEVKAKKVAAEYLQKNNVDPNQTTMVVSEDKKKIHIQGTKNVKHYFAQMIGIKSSNVKSRTKAIIAPAKSVEGSVRPLAVQMFNFSYGDPVTLKEGAGDGYNGNYGAVSLGGSGASVFRANALYGYKGTVSVGDSIFTEPGDMAGATNDIKRYISAETSSFDNFPRESIRLWTLPLVDSLEVNGQKSVTVVGFATFFVEDVINKSGKLEVNGRFVKYVLNAKVDETLRDTGAYGAKLSK